MGSGRSPHSRRCAALARPRDQEAPLALPLLVPTTSAGRDASSAAPARRDCSPRARVARGAGAAAFQARFQPLHGALEDRVSSCLARSRAPRLARTSAADWLLPAGGGVRARGGSSACWRFRLVPVSSALDLARSPHTLSLFRAAARRPATTAPSSLRADRARPFLSVAVPTALSRRVAAPMPELAARWWSRARFPRSRMRWRRSPSN